MSNNTINPGQLMQVISETPPIKIPELEFVKNKYIENYNACNREKNGELMYHRNVIHFKQAIAGSNSLAKSEPFSLYACFATAAVNGYSLDPNDNEVYLIARGGKACLDRQAGAYIKRLIRTGQIQYAEQAKLVYKGDIFQVENSRVVKHVESFQSDEIVAGYIKMVIDGTGADRFFIYRKSDFESWRKKSPNPRTIEKHGQNNSTYLSESLWDNGIVGGTQPEPNFLRTKIVKHAAKEKCWATGMTPISVESFAEVEVDTEDLPENVSPEFKNNIINPPKQAAPQLSQQANEIANANMDDDDFASTAGPSSNGKVFNDDDF